MLFDDRNTVIKFIMAGIMLLGLFVLMIFLDEHSRKFFIKEGGVIESATALGYFLCVAVMAYRGRLAYIKKYYHIFTLIIFFMLRELDFDTRFTTTGIFKIRFYTGANVPVLEKIIGVMIIALLLYIIFTIIQRHLRDFLINLKKQDIIAVGVFLTCALLGISQCLDGFDRKLKGVGLEVSHRLSLNAGAIEEIAELGVPIIILITLCAYFKKNRVSQNAASDENSSTP